MDSETIVMELNERFAKPLPEFYNRRIIVWHDEEREFEDQIDDLELINARVVKLNGTNFFEVKKLIGFDDTKSNILLYDPFSYENLEDNWLLDVELYSEEYRTDQISNYIQEMGLPDEPGIRKQVKLYKKFFGAKIRREKVKRLNRFIKKPDQLDMAVMLALCGLTDTNPNKIIRTVLCNGTDNETNTIYSDFVQYNADKSFWIMVEHRTGYFSENPDLKQLMKQIMFTAMSRTLNTQSFSELSELISSPHQAYCFDFVSEWLQSTDSDKLYEIARNIEDDMNLPEKFIRLSVDDLADTVCFPVIDEVILHKILTDINNNLIQTDRIFAIVGKRRNCVWYDNYKYYYEGILQIANMQKFFENHSQGFHTINAGKLWKEYTDDYYIMDTYYRLFHLNFSESLKNYYSDLTDLFSRTKDVAEGLYSTKFLGQLGQNWTDVCADDLKDYGYIPGIPKQENFYSSQVSNRDYRVFVIISDALRYEVGVSLAEKLQRETQGQVELTSMQAVFPTITKFGMASLLPHNQLSVKVKSASKTERLSVLADGMSTDSGYREKVLKAKNPESVALSYKNIIPMSRAERSFLVKGKEVVYIYHNKIDHASHTDETTVFKACDDAINELKNMVRIIVNEFGGTNIIITADHGFLYTNNPLTEDSKVDRTTDTEQDIEYGRRYMIMKKDAYPEYVTPVRFLDGNTEYSAFAPRENTRIKMPGAGMNFVHGGISLQEMVVPVINYHYLRNDSKEYKRNKEKYDTKPVLVKLLSSIHKTSNLIFALNFYQTEAVSSNRQEAVYMIYFVDSNNQKVSDIQKIIADKTSDNTQERVFRCNFHLKSIKYSNTDTYYLIIADENEMEVSREEFQIDIPFSMDEFDFFS